MSQDAFQAKPGELDLVAAEDDDGGEFFAGGRRLAKPQWRAALVEEPKSYQRTVGSGNSI